MSKRIPDKQRALVLQGGGALGAYEAGVFRAIYEKLTREDTNAAESNLFDIIAGTSSGALSGAVLVNHFLTSNKRWKDSDIKLVDFWKGLRSTTIADALIRENPYVHSVWKYVHGVNPNIATPEAARRFWSSLQFDFSPLGVPNVYQPLLQPNYRFLNPYYNYYWRYDYRPLRRYLSSFVEFPIKTTFDEGQPRLLVVSTDIQDYTSAVTFDSYKKEKDPKDGNDNLVTDDQGKISRWYSEYGEGQNKHLIFYDGGIWLDHLIASALAKYALDHPYMEDRISKTKRQFWDGGYLSNTPLRELIQSHRDYWMNRADGTREIDGLRKVPDLEVYIVDLHATVEKAIPTDMDSIDDREHDVMFHNKTSYDEKVAKLVTDYVNLATKLIKLAKDRGASKSEIDYILNSKDLHSTKRSKEPRTSRDLLDGRFKITNIWHVGRQDDDNSIFGKFTDFSTESIDKLIDDGEHDARLIIQ